MFTGPNIVNDGLVLALDAGSTKSYPGSGTTWYDLSGNGNNGTLTNGPTFNTDTVGKINSDGINDLIIINDTIIYLRTALTVETFIKYNSTYGSYKGAIASKWQTGAGTNNEWIIASVDLNNLSTGPGTLRVTLQYDNGQIQRVDGTTTMSVGNWYHCCLVYDGSYLSSYLNGNLENSAAALASSYKEYQQQPTSFLSFGLNFTYSTNASISMGRIYNRALTASEVLQNYNATKTRFGL